MALGTTEKAKYSPIFKIPNMEYGDSILIDMFKLIG